jgi:hypothetical protein
MIRRNVTLEGRPAWALIPQVSHAHLAGQIAEAWGAAPYASIEPRDELVAAVFHHDDGWAEWDEYPDVDPAKGQPRQFTEMPLAESIGIWTKSIDACAQIGPLAGWVVCGHFSALLRHTNRWQQTNIPESKRAQEALAAFDARREQWLSDWQQARPTSNTLEVADRGLHWLQFFDALSLWLCCANRSEPHRMPTPGGPEMTLTPSPSPEQVIAIAPWPLTVAELSLSITPRAIEPGCYPSRQAVADASATTVALRWRLVPAA